MQVVPQSIPLGTLETKPDPAAVPALVTVRSCVGVTVLKVAVTLTGAVIVTMHVGPLPEQAPPQAEKTELDAGVAVSVSVVPVG